MNNIQMKEFTKLETREWAEEQSNREWMIIRRYGDAWKAFNYTYEAAENEKPYIRRQTFIRKMATFFMEAQQ